MFYFLRFIRLKLRLLCDTWENGYKSISIRFEGPIRWLKILFTRSSATLFKSRVHFTVHNEILQTDWVWEDTLSNCVWICNGTHIYGKILFEKLHWIAKYTCTFASMTLQFFKFASIAKLFKNIERILSLRAIE